MQVKQLCFLYSGLILESKGMHAIFQKMGKKRAKQKTIKKDKKGEIWAKMKYFEKGQVTVCDYCMQQTARKGPGICNL